MISHSWLRRSRNYLLYSHRRYVSTVVLSGRHRRGLWSSLDYSHLIREAGGEVRRTKRVRFRAWRRFPKRFCPRFAGMPLCHLPMLIEYRSLGRHNEREGINATTVRFNVASMPSERNDRPFRKTRSPQCSSDRRRASPKSINYHRAI